MRFEHYLLRPRHILLFQEVVSVTISGFRAASIDFFNSLVIHLVCKMSENRERTHHSFSEAKVTSLKNCFLAGCETRRSMPLPCLNVKYKATASRQLA